MEHPEQAAARAPPSGWGDCQQAVSDEGRGDRRPWWHPASGAPGTVIDRDAVERRGATRTSRGRPRPPPPRNRGRGMRYVRSSKSETGGVDSRTPRSFAGGNGPPRVLDEEDPRCTVTGPSTGRRAKSRHGRRRLFDASTMDRVRGESRSPLSEVRPLTEPMIPGHDRPSISRSSSCTARSPPGCTSIVAGRRRWFSTAMKREWIQRAFELQKDIATADPSGLRLRAVDVRCIGEKIWRPTLIDRVDRDSAPIPRVLVLTARRDRSGMAALDRAEVRVTSRWPLEVAPAYLRPSDPVCEEVEALQALLRGLAGRHDAWLRGHCPPPSGDRFAADCYRIIDRWAAAFEVGRLDIDPVPLKAWLPEKGVADLSIFDD